MKKTWQFLTKEKCRLCEKGGMVVDTTWLICQQHLLGHNNVKTDFKLKPVCIHQSENPRTLNSPEKASQPVI